MTTPEERTRAVMQVSRAVGQMRVVQRRADGTTLVDSKTIDELLRAMRHYPWPADLDESARLAPHIWGLL